MPAYQDNRTGRWRYRVWVTLPCGKRDRLTGTPATDTRKAAEHAERLHVLRIMNPGLVATPSEPEAAEPRKEVPTVGEFAEQFLAEQTGAVKESARDGLRSVVMSSIVPFLGSTRLDEIDQPLVNRYIASMSKLARGTVNNRLAALSSLLTYAGPKDEGGAGHIGRCMLKLHVKDEPAPIAALARDGVERLLKACKSDRDRVAVLLAAEAGLRVGEIIGVQWTDIKDGRITVRRQIDQRRRVTKPKHDRVREVPLSPALVEALSEVPKRGIWIVAREDGDSLTYEAMRGMLLRLYERAVVTIPVSDTGERRPWHSLRHYFGTWSAACGVPMPVLKELMGHKDIATTMIYVDVHAAQKDDAIALAFGAQLGNRRATAQKTARK